MSVFKLGSEEECLQRHFDFVQVEEMVYCRATWDKLLCWPPTPTGATVSLGCPSLLGLDTSKYAYRKCGQDGRWEGKFPGDYSNPRGFTNYTNCYTPEAYAIWKKYYGDKSTAQRQLMKDIVNGTRTMEIVGLCTSLITSLISLFIFSYFRSLRCHRTRIHMNLFLSIIVQTFIRLVVYVDQHIAKNNDPSSNGNGAIYDTPVFCESLVALLEYTKSVQFMWMLIEGFYLHNMIAVSVFTGRPNYVVFYGIGWGLPVPFIIAWTLSVSFNHNVRCWYTYFNLNSYWIIEAPRAAVIAVNMFFLLNIIRVLVVKLRNSHSNEPQVLKVRKAVKAAVVLLPLLGITNFVVMTEAPSDDVIKFGLWSYTTHFLVSFQGFLISLLYCFLNGEVQHTIKRHLCTTSQQMRWESSLSSIRVYNAPRYDKVQMTIKKHWQRYRQGRLVQSQSFRRLSRSLSVFTSITDVPTTQTSRLSPTPTQAVAVCSVNSSSTAVPLLRDVMGFRESTM